MNAEITTVVIYHGGCPDGVASAWALSLALDNNRTTGRLRNLIRK